MPPPVRVIPRDVYTRQLLGKQTPAKPAPEAFVQLPRARCKEYLSMPKRKSLFGLDLALAVVVGFLIMAVSLKAQEQVLHAFNGRDGVRPTGGVIFTRQGTYTALRWEEDVVILAAAAARFSSCHQKQTANGLGRCCIALMARTGSTRLPV